jgi:hypothetical protein
VGFLLPQAIALLNQVKWTARVKSIVAFAACVIAAGITTVAAGDFDATNLILSATTVFAVARTSYAGLWRPTGLAPAIEEATSLGTADTPEGDV